ncbi:sigma-70 family RNA polymerase sigma factor [Polymorphospora rubra]|uniref:sigma-70 family RNA polymerase sigma factor n=1 Tax=Polymorphospora rubra TaxID=338584 RepID=UPI003400076C
METTADVELVTAAQRGDRQALADLLAAHLPLVHNVVGRALPERSDVDDVVQETMLRAVERLSDLRDPARFRSWLLTIAIRQVKDRMRARRQALSRQTPLTDYTEAPDPDTDIAPHAVDRISRVEERHEFLAAVRWLTTDERQLLALWWQEVNGTLTRTDVADTLAISIAHAGVRIQRMKAQLMLARTVLRACRLRPRCAGLAEATRGWDGGPDPRWFRKLARHVRHCPTCGAAGTHLPVEHHVVAIGLLPASTAHLPELLGTAAVAGKAAAGTTPLFDAVRRLAEHLSVKPAAVVATPVVGAVAVLAVTLLPPLAEDDGLAQPLPVPPATAGATPPSVSARPSASPSAAPPTEIFVAADGDDRAAGTRAQPYATLNKAVSVVRPGQTIFLRGGVHRATEPVRIDVDGTPDRRITLVNFPGERPTLDASRVAGDGPYLTLGADHWTIEGIDIVKAPRDPLVCQSCSHNVFRNLSVHDNGGTGLVLRGAGTSDNQILDSDFHHNTDAAGRDADGLAFRSGSGPGNVVRGCRTFDNVDDGLAIDGFADPVTIDGTWSFGNGINRWDLPEVYGSGHGFDLGDDPTAHVVTRSAAWKNNGHGFTGAGARGTHRIVQNTAFRNAGDGFAFPSSPAVFRDNLALGNFRHSVLVDHPDAAGNSWNEPGWKTEVIREIDPATAEAPRPADGTLPDTDYLTHTNDPRVGAPMKPVR